MKSKRKRHGSEAAKEAKRGRTCSAGQVERILRRLPKSSLDFSQVYDSLRNANELLIVSAELELFLWRQHHTRIAVYRSKLVEQEAKSGLLGSEAEDGQQAPDTNEDGESILEFITKSSQFYEDLLSSVELIYATEEGKLSKESMHNSCRRLLTRLGDLARYKEDIALTADYSIAKKYYEQAAKLCSTDGNAHNQLAVVAMYKGDVIRALYHHLRSMFVEAPASKGGENLQQTLAKVDKLVTKRKQAASSKFFILASALLEKTERLHEVISQLSITLEALSESIASGTNEHKTWLAVHAVTILIVSIDDFFTGALYRSLGRCGRLPPRKYLHCTLEAVLKLVHLFVTLTIQDSSRTMVPALGVFFIWLSNATDAIRAILETELLRRSFLQLLEQSEQLLLVLTPPSAAAGEVGIIPDPVKGVGALWEDQEFKGFSFLEPLLNLNDGEESAAAEYSSLQLSAVRFRRLEAALNGVARKAGFWHDHMEEPAVNVEEDVVPDSPNHVQSAEEPEQIMIPDTDESAPSSAEKAEAAPAAPSPEEWAQLHEETQHGGEHKQIVDFLPHAKDCSGRLEEVQNNNDECASVQVEAARLMELHEGDNKSVDEPAIKSLMIETDKDLGADAMIMHLKRELDGKSEELRSAEDKVTKLTAEKELIEQELKRVEKQKSEEVRALEQEFERERRTLKLRIGDLESKLDERRQQALALEANLKELREAKKDGQMEVTSKKRRAEHLQELEALHCQEQALRNRMMETVRGLFGSEM